MIKRWMKKLIAVLLLFALALSFSGCSGNLPSSGSSLSESIASKSESESEPENIDRVLAICMGSVTHPIHRIAQLGFIEAAEELGYPEPRVSGLEEGSIDELIEVWKQDITDYNIKGVAVWTGGDFCYEFMKTLSAQGIQVVVPYFEHGYDEAHEFLEANIPTNEYKSGVVAADFLVKALEEKGVTKGALGVTVNGSGLTIYLPYEGFCDRIAELDVNYQVLDYYFEGAEVTEAAQSVERYITENPSIVGAYGSTGGSAASWSTAVKNLGRQDIIIVGSQYPKESLDILQSGGVSALVSIPLYESCYGSVYALDKLLNGETFDQSSWSINMPTNIITADGEGVNGIEYYRDLYARSEAVDWDKYIA